MNRNPDTSVPKDCGQINETCGLANILWYKMIPTKNMRTAKQQIIEDRRHDCIMFHICSYLFTAGMYIFIYLFLVILIGIFYVLVLQWASEWSLQPDVCCRNMLSYHFIIRSNKT